MGIKFITGNIKKVTEFNIVLAPFFVEQINIDLEEIQELDAKKIIDHKILEAMKEGVGEFVVEDSSLYLEALGGKLPGPLVKWFNDTLGTNGIYEIAHNFANYAASAITIIGYVNENKEILYFEGLIKGTIVEPKGEYLFGYDPIFVPDGQSLTQSELKSSGNFLLSPRGIAVAKLKAYLENIHT